MKDIILIFVFLSSVMAGYSQDSLDFVRYGGAEPRWGPEPESIIEHPIDSISLTVTDIIVIGGDTLEYPVNHFTEPRFRDFRLVSGGPDCHLSRSNVISFPETYEDVDIVPDTIAVLNLKPRNEIIDVTNLGLYSLFLSLEDRIEYLEDEIENLRNNSDVYSSKYVDWDQISKLRSMSRGTWVYRNGTWSEHNSFDFVNFPADGLDGDMIHVVFSSDSGTVMLVDGAYRIESKLPGVYSYIFYDGEWKKLP